MAYYFLDVTHDWNYDFARCGDVTKARDKKQTVLCPLLISKLLNWQLLWAQRCLLQSYKSTLQLCGLSEQVDIAFITKKTMGMTPQWLVCTLKGSGSGCRRCTRLSKVFSYMSIIYCSLFLHNMLLKRSSIRHTRNKWSVVDIYIFPPVRQF